LARIAQVGNATFEVVDRASNCALAIFAVISHPSLLITLSAMTNSQKRRQVGEGHWGSLVFLSGLFAENVQDSRTVGIVVRFALARDSDGRAKISEPAAASRWCPQAIGWMSSTGHRPIFAAALQWWAAEGPGCRLWKNAQAEGQKFRSFSIGEAVQETGDVEQGTPIGPTTLLAGQITDIAYKATVV
jgi:hypothetical protein